MHNYTPHIAARVRLSYAPSNRSGLVGVARRAEGADRWTEARRIYRPRYTGPDRLGHIPPTYPPRVLHPNLHRHSFPRILLLSLHASAAASPHWMPAARVTVPRAHMLCSCRFALIDTCGQQRRSGCSIGVNPGCSCSCWRRWCSRGLQSGEAHGAVATCARCCGYVLGGARSRAWSLGSVGATALCSLGALCCLSAACLGACALSSGFGGAPRSLRGPGRRGARPSGPVLCAPGRRAAVRVRPGVRLACMLPPPTPTHAPSPPALAATQMPCRAHSLSVGRGPRGRARPAPACAPSRAGNPRGCAVDRGAPRMHASPPFPRASLRAT